MINAEYWLSRFNERDELSVVIGILNLLVNFKADIYWYFECINHLITNVFHCMNLLYSSNTFWIHQDKHVKQENPKNNPKDPPTDPIMPPSDQNSRKQEQESNCGQKGFTCLDKCFNKVKVHICEVKV